MSNSFTHHPDDGVLLRYIDGELTGRKARQVEKHLEACWQCRTEIEELKATVAECIRYRKNVPAPPDPWGDLSRGFARIDDSLGAEPFLTKLLRPAASLRWSLAAAAVLALVCGIYYQLRETPSVQAATLLRRAVAASAARPEQALRRVRFRSGSQQFIRAVAAGKPEAALPQTMQAKFLRAHYDSTEPLSARAFQAWRDSEPQKQDDVSTVADPQAHGGNCYRIRTTAATGDVAAATLMLRTADLVPVEGLLEFRDNQWIEFSEFTESPDRSTNALSASDVEVPERLAVPPSRLAVVAPRSSASVSDELQVLSALQKIGADLGDPIHVTLTPDKVLVSGEGVAPERRQLIQRTLESMPNVAVQFTEPVAAPIPEGSVSSPPAPSGTTRAVAPDSKIQSRLEEQLGGPAEFERFSSQILDVDDGAMSHAHALRNLARQFPAAAEAGLSVSDRHVLREMARENATALSGSVNTLQRQLRGVLTSLGGRAAPPGVSPLVSWQASAEDLFRDSQRVQVLVSVLLGVTSGQISGELPANLLGAISELRANVDRCQQLLAQEGGG
ncbi:MAG: zf-HC2 domain-containing protein [Candidatus Sulfopaludibacter sp.]|nr:zf-HC2 domain-containing protein [Candidatus Sulfopaludibacter sp.]